MGYKTMLKLKKTSIKTRWLY